MQRFNQKTFLGMAGFSQRRDGRYLCLHVFFLSLVAPCGPACTRASFCAIAKNILNKGNDQNNSGLHPVTSLVQRLDFDSIIEGSMTIETFS